MDEVTVWDGKGSMQTLADAEHVHDENGKCIKRRHGVRCEEETSQ